MAHSSTPTPKGPPDKVRLVQGASQPAYGFIYVGMDKGFLAEQNIQMEPLITTASTPLTIQTVISGSAHFGIAGTDAVINAIDKGGPLKIIGMTTANAPYALMVRPEVNGPADLKGKSCGASSIVAGDAPYLKAMMRNKYGLSYPADYNIIVAGGRTERTAALLSGGVQCIAVGPPDHIILAGQGMKLGAGSWTGDAFPDYQFGAIIARSDWANSNRDVVVRFLKASLQGMDWMFTNWDKPEATKYSVSPGQKVLPNADEALKVMYGGGPAANIQLRDLKPSLKGMRVVFDLLKEQGSVAKDAQPDWTKYLDMSFWEAATGKKFQYQ